MGEARGGEEGFVAHRCTHGCQWAETLISRTGAPVGGLCMLQGPSIDRVRARACRATGYPSWNGACRPACTAHESLKLGAHEHARTCLECGARRGSNAPPPKVVPCSPPPNSTQQQPALRRPGHARAKAHACVARPCTCQSAHLCRFAAAAVRHMSASAAHHWPSQLPCPRVHAVGCPVPAPSACFPLPRKHAQRQLPCPKVRTVGCPRQLPCLRVHAVGCPVPAPSAFCFPLPRKHAQRQLPCPKVPTVGCPVLAPSAFCFPLCHNTHRANSPTRKFMPLTILCLLRLQGEVFNGAILQQTFVVDFVVENNMCMECNRANANPNSWTACVQVRRGCEGMRMSRFCPDLAPNYYVHAPKYHVPAGHACVLRLRHWRWRTSAKLDLCCSGFLGQWLCRQRLCRQWLCKAVAV
eukprot:365012-Chlamydomonas_euryale.AAC.3